jgi:hypothetical protein
LFQHTWPRERRVAFEANLDECRESHRLLRQRLTVLLSANRKKGESVAKGTKRE